MTDGRRTRTAYGRSLRTAYHRSARAAERLLPTALRSRLPRGRLVRGGIAAAAGHLLLTPKRPRNSKRSSPWFIRRFLSIVMATSSTTLSKRPRHLITTIL